MPSSTYSFNDHEGGPISPQDDDDNDHQQDEDEYEDKDNNSNNNILNHSVSGDGVFINSNSMNANSNGRSNHKRRTTSCPYCSMTIMISIIVVLLAINIALLSSSLSSRSANQQASSSSASTSSSNSNEVRISSLLNNATLPAWKFVPSSSDTVLTKIAFGSCLSQNMPQPIWDTIMMSSVSNVPPDLFIFMGDNVYGDCTTEECNELKQAYYDWSLHPSLQSIATQIPFIATLDDHDYGMNNCDMHNPYKETAKRFFREFFNYTNDQVPWHDGVYQSFVFGSSNDNDQQQVEQQSRVVQIIVLDTRYDRSPFIETNNVSSPYRPVEESDITDGNDDPYQMLGEFQWQWLEKQVKETKADLRIVVSSVQVLNNGTGFEAWRHIPAERERLYTLLQNERVIIVSGDRHVGGIYESNNLIEITSSSVTHSIPLGTFDNCQTADDCDEVDPSRISGPLIRDNHYGMIEIDWENGTVTVSLRRTESSYGSSYQHHPSTEQYHHSYPQGDAGDVLFSKMYPFNQL